MEKFIDNVICSLMTYDVECQKFNVAGKPVWVMTIENRIIMTFDKHDVIVVRENYERNKYVLDAENRKKYECFFSLCK